jgi:hypothetical protein
MKFKLLEDEKPGLFTTSVNSRLGAWTRAVVSGFSGGQGVIRLVGAGGILLGLEDLHEKIGVSRGRFSTRGKTEDEVVVAVAEVMDVYGARKDDAWEKEFHPETEHGEGSAIRTLNALSVSDS